MCTTIHSVLNSQTIDDDEESEEELAINLEVTFIFNDHINSNTPSLSGGCASYIVNNVSVGHAPLATDGTLPSYSQTRCSRCGL